LTAAVANTPDQSRDKNVDNDFGRSQNYSDERNDDEKNSYEANTFAAENIANELSEQEQAEVLADKQLQSVRIQEPFVSPHVEQGESHLSIAPNAKWKDEQQAQEAVELLAQGQADLAVEKLQHFISVEKQPRESMKALLDIFVAQEKPDAVRNSLAQASYLTVVDQTFYAAKVAIIQQEEIQAIQLLEAHLDEAEKNENYRSLLAGLYQRTGSHLEAANHYRRLLSVFGDKPAYWLGFALAQDSLNQGPVAAQAYQRVNQYADLQPQVRTYIQQRIAALQQ
jgi:DNA-binding SARP family transcriptional activator